MIQRLPIAPAGAKAGNASKNVLSEARQIIYYWYREKAFSKKV